MAARGDSAPVEVFASRKPHCLLARGLAGVPAELETAVERCPALLVEDGRILAVGEEALAAGAAGAPRVEVDAWLSPAPLDAHVHLFLGGTPARNLAAWRRAGVAAVRELGRSPRRADASVRGACPPLVVDSGVGLGAQGEGGSWLARGVAPRAREFERQARELVAAGAGLLKVFVSGLLDFQHPGRVEHPQAVDARCLAAVVSVAHEAGLKVAVHASGEEAVTAALEAGVDSVEHGFFLSRATFERMAAQGVAWVPTLAAVVAHARDPQGRHDQKIRSNLWEIVHKQAQGLRWAARLDVGLVLGSDAGSYGLPHGRALFLEMAAWLEAGVEPQLVWVAATRRAARLLGLEGEVGVLAPGARAWLLGTRRDPRRDPLGLARPCWRNF